MAIKLREKYILKIIFHLKCCNNSNVDLSLWIKKLKKREEIPIISYKLKEIKINIKTL
jgi:hypothetical protein